MALSCLEDSCPAASETTAERRIWETWAGQTIRLEFHHKLVAGGSDQPGQRAERRFASSGFVCANHTLGDVRPPGKIGLGQSGPSPSIAEHGSG
jgi:hypothetical protein